MVGAKVVNPKVQNRKVQGVYGRIKGTFVLELGFSQDSMAAHDTITKKV